MSRGADGGRDPLSVRHLVVNSGWVGAAVFVPVAVRVAAIPIRTRLLDPAAYAQLATWSAVVAIVAPVATWAGLGLVRHRTGATGGAGSFVRTWLGATGAAAVALVVAAAAAGVTGAPDWSWVALVALGELAVSAGWAYGRAVDVYRFVALTGIAGAVAGVGVGTALLPALGPVGALAGWAGANLAAATVMGVRLAGSIRHDLGREPGWQWRELVAFAGPGTVANLAWALSVHLDRILLVGLVPAADIGRYAVANSLVAGPLSGLFTVLSTATWTQAVQAHRSGGDAAARRVLWCSSTLYALVATPTAVFVACFGHVGLALLTDAAFHPAAIHLPPLALALWLYGLVPYRNQHLLLRDRAGAQALGALGAVGAGVGALYGLVPVLGPVGASWATAAGYAVAFGTATVLCRRDARIDARIDWATHRRAGAVAAALCVPVAWGSAAWPPVVQIGAALGAAGMVAVAVWRMRGALAGTPEDVGAGAGTVVAMEATAR